jgi:hypothetical protein
MAKSQPIVLDPDLIEAGLWELALLDEKLVAIAGTQAKRLAEAGAAVDLEWSLFKPKQITLRGTTVEQGVQLGNLLDEIVQFRKELIDAKMQETKNTEGRDILVAQREKLVKDIEAYHTVLSSVTDVPELVIPKRPGVRGPSGPRQKPTGTFLYWTEVDGVRKDQSASQNAFSSVSYYHGQKLMDHEVKHPPTEDLKAAVKAAGGDSEVKGSAWSVTFPNGTKMGLDILTTEDEDADAEGHDDSDGDEA